jgi:nitrogen-specific signal transduction histidine kinase
MDAGSCISVAALPGWANLGLEDARAILDNCSVAVHFVDANGTIIYANKAELDCLGTSSRADHPRRLSSPSPLCS